MSAFQTLDFELGFEEVGNFLGFYWRIEILELLFLGDYHSFDFFDSGERGVDKAFYLSFAGEGRITLFVASKLHGGKGAERFPLTNFAVGDEGTIALINPSRPGFLPLLPDMVMRADRPINREI